MRAPGQLPPPARRPVEHVAARAPDDVGQLGGAPLQEVVLQLRLAVRQPIVGQAGPGAAGVQADDGRGPAEDQALPPRRQRVVAVAEVLGEVDEVEAVVVAEPRVDAAGDGGVGRDGGEVDGALRQRDEAEAEAAVVGDPVADGAIDGAAAVGVEQGDPVAGAGE